MGLNATIALDKELHFCETGMRLALEYLKISRDVLNDVWRESIHDGVYAFGSGALMDSANSSTVRYLGDQGDMEIRWSPAPHFIAAFNLAGSQPGGFFDHVVNNRPPIAANAGLTFRF